MTATTENEKLHPALEVFYRHCQTNGELMAAMTAIKVLKRDFPLDYARLEALAGTATFERRHYGGEKFYTWAHLPGRPISDPWPASVYPKNALIIHLLIDETRIF